MGFDDDTAHKMANDPNELMHRVEAGLLYPKFKAE